MQKSKKLEKILLIAAIPVLLIVLTLCIHQRSQKPETQDFSAGISRIQALEAADPNTVDDTLKEYRHQELVAERDARLAQLDSGEISVWSLFDDYVIVGDSRAADFRSIAELNANRDLGKYGNTARNLVSNYDTIRAMNPSYLIVIVGLVDIRFDYIQSTDDFRDYMTGIIEDLQSSFPDTMIFLNPLFPLIEAGLKTYPKLVDVPDYDLALREVADSTGVYYVNCDNITMQDSYYRSDGIHFTREFMELWAKQIVMTIYDAELGLYESSAQNISAASASGEPADSAEASSAASSAESSS